VTLVILYSVHTLLAVVLAASTLVAREWRRPILLVAAAVGFAGGVSLALASGDETGWRSTTLGQPQGPIAGAAVACAWLLAGALGSDRTLGSAALVGLASTGVLLATLGDWIVPALVLWLTSSVALVALVSMGGLRVGALLALGVSDLALVGAFSLHALVERSWTVPLSLGGLPLALAAASFVVRSGALPLTGIWETLDSRAAPALPLLLGGPLALLGVPLSGSGPWVSFAALVAALGLSGLALFGPELRLSMIGSWPVWLSLGLIAAAPVVLIPVALAALLSLSAVALWPATHGSARSSRGVLLGLLPITAGWMAVVGSAVVTFEREGASSGGRPVAWSLIAGLLPLIVAAGVALATRVARQSVPNTSEPPARWATHALLVGSLCMGLLPPSAVGLARDTLGDLDRVLILNGAAVGLAFLAGAISYVRGPRGWPSVGANVEAIGGTLVYSEDRADNAVMVGVFALIALGSLATVVYLAFEGLSYGFLPPSNL
jgi:hypothetical protein